MANGSFTGTTSNQYIIPRITWSAVSNINGNYSDVTATLAYTRTNTGYTTYGAWSGTINIGGTSTAGSKTITSSDPIKYGSYLNVLTATTRIYHDTDGSKRITISGTGALSSGSLTSTTISATVSLDTIPRATKPTLSPTTQVIGGSINIDLSARASASFTHTLTYSFGNLTGTISTKTTSTAVSWTLPDTFLAQLPSATSGSGSIICTTYNGTNAIGTATASFTATVPESILPAISNITIADNDSAQYAVLGAYVQKHTALAVTVSAVGGSGGSVSRVETTIDGSTYTGASITTAILRTSGSLPLTVTVTDSRGRTATESRSVSVLPYAAPTVRSIAVQRCLPDGTTDDDGDHVKVTLEARFSGISGGNSLYYRILYKRSNADYWDTAVGDTQIDNSGATTITFRLTGEVLDAEFDPDYAYDVQLEVWDYFTEDLPAGMSATVYGQSYLIDIDATTKAMAIGKAAEMENTLDVAWDIFARGNLHFLDETRQLWTGAWYMIATQSATLKAAVSEQTNGIVLVFCPYSSGAALDEQYQCFFIPKAMVARGALSYTFQLTQTGFARVGVKTLTISDTAVSGDSSNSETGTANGITYANNRFVLRAVYGV